MSGALVSMLLPCAQEERGEEQRTEQQRPPRLLILQPTIQQAHFLSPSPFKRSFHTSSS
jgi:hypothetical protein